MKIILSQNSLSVSTVSFLSFDLQRLLTTCTFLPFFRSFSVAPEPNYPQRTQRFYHRAGSRSSVHHTHYTSLQNSQHTCCCLRRGVITAVSNPTLIWQVQIHLQFWFQSSLLEGYYTNCVTYLLSCSLAVSCLSATFVLTVGTDENMFSANCGSHYFANVFTVAFLPLVSVALA